MGKNKDELTENDFIECSNWLLDLNTNSVFQNKELDDLQKDEPYLTRTNYILKDSTNLIGFCFLYEISGFKCFYESKQVSLGNWVFLEKKAAVKIAKSLKKDLEDVFPIEYICSSKLFGRVRKGMIDFD